MSQDIAAPAAVSTLAGPLATEEEVDHGHDQHVHTFFDTDQYPASHFEDAVQQKEASTLGMWAFLATEVLLFAGLFLVYAIYRHIYFVGFEAGSHLLDVTLGTINTIVLLLSSLFVVLAVNQAQRNSSKGIVLYLIGTIVLGLVFFVIKGFEWHHDYVEGLIPWMQWDSTRLAEVDGNHKIKMFMILYFAMTGTHAVHMVVGMVILGVIAFKASRGAYNAKYHTPLEMAGLYWHFVDIVWVFLVPTLYLIDLYSKKPGH